MASLKPVMAGLIQFRRFLVALMPVTRGIFALAVPIAKQMAPIPTLMQQLKTLISRQSFNFQTILT